MAKDSPLQFKGTTLKVIQTLLKSTHPATLKAALGKLTGDAPDFFDGELAVLDFSGVEAFPDSVAWDELVALLRAAGLNPALVRGIPAGHEAAAAKAGLMPLRDDSFGRPGRPGAADGAARPAGEAASAPAAEAKAAPAKAAPAGGPQPAAAPDAGTPGSSARPAAPAPSANTAGQAAASKPTSAAETPLPVAPPAAASSQAPLPLDAPVPRTLVVDKPLRSGQRVYAKGCDLVVLAMVSAGAEVIADGNIHIYAPLRGRALAGANGDHSARILTTCMEAELVSVAGLYRTFEQGVPPEVAGQPAVIKWQAGSGPGSLVVAPLAIR